MGLRLWATEGSGMAREMAAEGATSPAMRTAEKPATRLMTVWVGAKCSSERTLGVIWGRTARMMVSQVSSTA